MEKTNLEYYNEKSNTTRDDDFALATAYSKSSNCVKAVKYYDKVARIKDTLGQIALYHAGECYMNLNQPAYARTAFEAAAQLDMDVMIQEDALYNYAILSYKLDLNVYDEAVESFELYLRKYPNSPRKTVVYQYLVNVYSSTKNYAKALESLDKVANKDIKLKSAYQLIAFNRGVELYQRSDYQQAIDAFKLVEKYPIDQDISAKAIFWIGDAEYQLKHFDAAVSKYRAFLAMPTSRLSALRNDAYYNIGYAYLANKNYVQTQEAFRVYLTQPGLTDKKKLADAHMRLADEYYRTRENNQDAVNQYIAALELKSGFEDQALYYMARTYGFLGKRDDKIQRLLDIINNYPNSKYVQSSVYEVALTYFNAGNDDKAKRYFEQVIRDYPKSTSVIDAYHNLGNIAFKKGNYEEAEMNYKKVLSDYVVNDTICKREVYALADIYVKQGRLNKKAELSQLYACADSISTQVEDDYYRKAFDLYEDSMYSKSIVEFDDYLSKYPKGKYLKEVLNYKADGLFILKREEEAIAIYKITLLEPNNDFTEVASQRTSKFLFNKGDREGALPYYTRLEQVTSNPELLNNARIGQMRCNFVLENFENAVQYAARVLSANQTPAIRLESEYIHGMSLSKINRFAEALSSLEYVVKNTTTVIASEAKYTIAVGYFDKADMTKSENEVRALLKMKPGYDYWIAKALILQTRILMAKKDLFQAENTIQSVISNYPIKDDGVLAEAGELYDEIMRLKSQPKTIQTPDPGTVIELEDKTGNK